MGECGSGSRRAKMTHKNRNEEIEKFLKFHVYKFWKFPFAGWRLLLWLGRPSWTPIKGLINCIFLSKKFDFFQLKLLGIRIRIRKDQKCWTGSALKLFLITLGKV
jgi:hypothetical protein